MSAWPRTRWPASPADPASLVDVDALIGAYHDVRPDPADPTQRVLFGTSGHRGSAFRGAFNEAHILAITEAICRYRMMRGYSGPLFIGKDTHALSEPAQRTALEVLVARGVDVRVDARDGVTPTPVGLARDPRREPRPGARHRPRRRDRRHAVAQPARGRRLQVQPAQRRPGRHRRHDVDPGRGEPAARGLRRRRRRGHRACCRTNARARSAGTYDFLGPLRRRPRLGHRHGRDRGLEAAHRRRPDGRRLRRSTGARSASATAST